jgi:hypothetical protein
LRCVVKDGIEAEPVLVIGEDVLACVPAKHYMIDCPRCMYATFPCHGVSISPNFKFSRPVPTCPVPTCPVTHQGEVAHQRDNGEPRTEHAKEDAQSGRQVGVPGEEPGEWAGDISRAPPTGGPCGARP